MTVRGADDGEILLRLDGVQATYAGDGVQALRGVDLEVRRGSIVALLGANSAGKTTTVRVITGLLEMNGGRLRAGEVVLDGRPITRWAPAARVRAGISQVMEGRRVFAGLSVEDNLRAGGATRSGRARVHARDRVYALFPRLAERSRQRAGLLSGGEQQMLAIGRALMQEPRLLVLDEPSLGLAPIIVEQIRTIVSAIREEGTSVLLIEQNTHLALSVADYGYVMEQGRVATHGPAAQLADDDAVRQSYLGGGQDAGAAYQRLRAARTGLPA